MSADPRGSSGLDLLRNERVRRGDRKKAETSARRPGSNGVGHFGRYALDLVASSLVAMGILSFAAIKRLSRRGALPGARKLLVIEGTHAFSTLRERKIEHAVTSRDVGGFFSHVWTVHPAVGASPDHSEFSAVGSPTSTDVSPRHTFIEGKVGLLSGLVGWKRTNFALAQASLVWRLSRLIRRENVSLVQVSDPYYLGLLGLLLARSHRLPLVVFVYGNFDSLYEMTGFVAYPRLIRWRWLEKRIERYVLSRADLVVAGNEDNLRFVLRNGATVERSTVFRPAGWIHPDHFDVEPEHRRRDPSELGLGERPYILLLGRLVAVKHPEDVLVVAKDVRERGHDITVVFVGDGPMRQELQDMAVGMGLSGNAVFVGARNQNWINAALSSAEVILSPLTGLALIEACLSGTPVVAYDAEWQSELIRSGDTGLLVPYRDTRRMAEGVCYLLDNPEEGRRMADRARQTALKLMDRTALLHHQRSQYHKLLNGSRG